MVTPQLSILLATVENRKELFAKLHAHITSLARGLPVEILFACDAKQISIGKKRQNLLEQASGDYVVYVDDDDWVSGRYVDAILNAIANKPDCVGFEIKCTINGATPVPAIASMRYPQWCENRDGYRFCRSIYHKTPVLREIALKVGFPDMRYAEDRAYSDGVMRLVKSEVFIPEQLYHYRFKNEGFNEKYGIRPEMRRRGRARPYLDYKGRRV